MWQIWQCVLWYKHEIWHTLRFHHYKNICILGHLRFHPWRRWWPFSKMATMNLFSHILLTTSSKSVVWYASICFRGLPFQIYYFWPSPTFTSTIFKDGVRQDKWSYISWSTPPRAVIVLSKYRHVDSRFQCCEIFCIWPSLIFVSAILSNDGR